MMPWVWIGQKQSVARRHERKTRSGWTRGAGLGWLDVVTESVSEDEHSRILGAAVVRVFVAAAAGGARLTGADPGRQL